MTHLAARTLLVRGIAFRTLVGLAVRVGLAGGGALGLLETAYTLLGGEVHRTGVLQIVVDHPFLVLVLWPLQAACFLGLTAALAHYPLRLWMSKGEPVRMSFEVVVRPSERQAGSDRA